MSFQVKDDRWNRLFDNAQSPALFTSNPGYFPGFMVDQLKADLNALLDLLDNTQANDDVHQAWLDRLTAIVRDALMDNASILQHLTGGKPGSGRGLLADSDHCQRQIDQAKTRLNIGLHAILSDLPRQV